MIPKKLLETNIIHLPTVKTHVFTTITGAMKNAFGGLLHHNRHWAHADIHNTLVDLLTIQYEIHQNIFAVMDGTFAGDGPGPRAMNFKVKNMILASHDQVAIDSISAKLMGFDPLTIPKLRIAHEKGLGIANPREIKVKNYKTRWGSCDKKGRLTFNWHLIKAPHSIVDYVVIHELCHMIQCNHSKNFWQEVEKYDPLYKDHKKWLKENGNFLIA